MEGNQEPEVGNREGGRVWIYRVPGEESDLTRRATEYGELLE